MISTHVPKNGKNISGHQPLQTTLLLCTVILIFISSTQWTSVYNMQEFAIDEGFNLIKSLMYKLGYSFFTEVWSNQPPGLPILLGSLFNVSTSVVFSRLTIVFFSAILVLSLTALVNPRFKLGGAGVLISIMSASILMADPLFRFLSTKVMVGLPALALGFFSLVPLQIANIASPPSKEKNNIRRLVFLALSALLFTLGLSIKVWILPISLALCLNTFFGREPLLKVHDLARWIVLTIVFVLILLFATSASFSVLFNQLILDHLRSAQSSHSFTSATYLLAPWHGALFTLAAIAAVFLYTRKGITVSIGCLTIYAIMVFLLWRPIWEHHFLALSFPSAWVLGELAFDLFVYSSVSSDPASKKIWQSFFAIGSITLVLAIFFGRNEASYENQMMKIHPFFSENILPSKANYGKIITDFPIYAYLLESQVPAELAVIDLKGLSAGRVSVAQMAQAFHTFKPDLVILARFPQLGRDLVSELGPSSTLLYEDPTSNFMVLVPK